MEPDWMPAPTPAGRRRRSSRPFVIAAPDYTEIHGGVVALHRLCDRLNALGHEAFVVPLGSAEGITRTGWRTPLWDRGTLDDAVLVYPEIVTGNPLLGRRIVRWLLHRPSWFTGEGMSEGPEDLIVTFDTQIAPECPVLRVPLVDPTVFFPKDALGHGRLLWIGKGVLPADFDQSGSKLITPSWPASRAGLAALLRSATVLYSCDWLTSLIDEALMCGTPVVLVGDQEWRRDEVVMRPGMTWAGRGEEAIDRATVAASAFYPRYLASLPDYDRSVEDFVQLVGEHFTEGAEATSPADTSTTHQPHGRGAVDSEPMSSPPGAEGSPTGTDDDQGLGSASPEESESLRRRLRNAEAATELLRAQLHGQEWLASRVSELESALARAESELDGLRALSPFARVAVGRRLRTRAVRYLRSVSEPSRALPAVVAHPAALEPQDPRYPMWVECYDTLDDEARAAIGQRLDALSDRPLVSIILPVFNTPESYLREAIDSVRAQLYPRWELCIADDCSTSPWVPTVLAEYTAADPRIRVTTRPVNGHISASSNSALELATGRWIALFDHDDLLAEHALALAVLAIAEVPGAGLLYSDEDHIDDDGRRFDPYMKPDFDPVLVLGQNYLSHLCMLRRDLVDEAGRYREGYEGSQDWDLVLRVCERLRPEQVVHVPHVLYHWRSHPGSTSVSLAAKPYAADAARRAVTDIVGRRPVPGRVGNVADGGFTRVHWDLPEDPPKVSVVVLPRRGDSFIRCIDSIKVRSTYPEVEVVVVDDGGARAPLREFLRDWGPTLNVVREERDVSDSALRNRGAMVANGDVLCFVHDDVEVLTDCWLEEMVGLLAQPGIGAVGAKLLYDDGTVQHAGFVAGIGGTVGSPHRGFDRLEPGYFSRAALAQCFSAVSWAAMAVRREAFEAVGGFDEDHLSAIFGDVDFCFRLREAGWRTAFTPFAELLHREAKDEPRDTEGENGVRLARDIRYLQTRWADILADDPAYSPNLSLAHETFPLAFPPRVSYRRSGHRPFGAPNW